MQQPCAAQLPACQPVVQAPVQVPQYCKYTDPIANPECCAEPPAAAYNLRVENLDCQKARFQWDAGESCAEIRYWNIDVQGSNGQWYTMPTFEGKANAPGGLRHWDLDQYLLTSEPLNLAVGADIKFRVRGTSKCGSGEWSEINSQDCTKVLDCVTPEPAKDPCVTPTCQPMFCCQMPNMDLQKQCGCPQMQAAPEIAVPKPEPEEPEFKFVPSVAPKVNDCRCPSQRTPMATDPCSCDQPGAIQPNRAADLDNGSRLRPS